MARFVLLGGALFAAAIAVSAVHGRAFFLVTTRQWIVLLVLPALAAVVLPVAAVRLSPARRIRVATVVASTVLSLLAANVLVADFASPGTAVGAAAPKGAPFDRRSVAQVVASLRSQGKPAVPAVYPTNFILSERGRAALSAADVGFPLAGISNRPTVFCNESGEYIVYDSDQYGFQNPPDAWEGRPDIAVVGDSFVHGVCVPPERNIAGVLRQHGRTVLNLGMGSAGPLSALGRIEEYARALAPANVFWFFYEGNDAYDLEVEAKVPTLMAYLTTERTQAITSHQAEVDDALLAYAEEYGSTAGPSPGLVRGAWEFLTLRRLRTALSLDAPGELPVPEAPDFELYGRILAKARDEVASWGGRMHFVYLPAHTRYKSPDEVAPFKDDLLASVRRLGVPTIDVVEVFEPVPDPLDLFPSRSQGHYVEAGYQLVAEAILRALDEQRPT
jgi:lysophospholipase L1-like esterase